MYQPIKQKRAKKQSDSMFKKQMEMALKESLLQAKTDERELNQIEEMKTFFPTETQFASPMNYIEYLV